MTYPSVDKLQNMLAEKIFGYAKDKKKASGRALGTLVEIVTYYTACAWGLRDFIAIEKPVPEFANSDITHNVEFSLHPIVANHKVKLQPLSLPVTARKLLVAAGAGGTGKTANSQQLLTSDLIMRNAAVIEDNGVTFTSAHLECTDASGCAVALTELLAEPFAIFECKRVGVEEGMRKGPQTIEKAKQGAYVARTVSSLQKFRLGDGKVHGVIDTGNGRLKTGAYDSLLREIVDGSDPNLLRHFILTVGVVSNHGNWFTSENQNKELRVLAHSYDWLLFLTDAGLCQFIEKLLLSPVADLKPAREAFLASYNGESTGNCFTKVKIRVDADAALKRYFSDHETEVESWYNVIAPIKASIKMLREEIVKLAEKDWKRIRQP